ncbi:MAG: two-component system response regulator [Nitrospirae bacterium CG17_big_fil_post_rev_8_21_14_2_50_50_9]|nr:MAG: two-component system response regulator [Nitrospirae bacterium CG17_big_fil_post_rev_8_21_14_2_50_50_9]
MTGKRILIVDDDSIIRKFISFALRTQGLEVITAQDGIEALEILAVRNVCLVITDLNMPRMDGFKLIRQIRNLAETSNLPVMMLTTEADEESRTLGFQAGATEYMIKPVSRENLLAKVLPLIGMNGVPA